MSLNSGLFKYAALMSLMPWGSVRSLKTLFLICFNSLSISPCLGRNLYSCFVSSNKSLIWGWSLKSSSVGIMNLGSNTSSVWPVSVPGSLGGSIPYRLFVYFCITSSSTSGISAFGDGSSLDSSFGTPSPGIGGDEYGA